MSQPRPLPPEYLVRHIQDTLAADPRARELGVHARVDGPRVVLAGTVATPQQRAAIVEVVQELLTREVGAGHKVVNELAVASHGEDGPAEELL